MKGEQRGDTLLLKSPNNDMQQQQGQPTIAREQGAPSGSNMLHVTVEPERAGGMVYWGNCIMKNTRAR